MEGPSWMPLPEKALRTRILRLADARGVLELFSAPHVVVTRASGHLSEEFADGWIRATAPVFASQSSVSYFNDWSLLEGYDSAARKKLTDWSLLHRKQIEATYFLTGSRMVSMGVSVAGAALALTGLRFESPSKTDFVTRIETALARR